MTIVNKRYETLETFLNDTNKNSDEEKIFSIIVSKKGVTDYIYDFSSIHDLHPTRSVCKIIVALCIGRFLYSKESRNTMLRDFDMPIWPLLCKLVTLKNDDNLEVLKKITLKHLLSQTTGYDNKELLFSHTIKNIDSGSLLDYVINEPIPNEPGVKFVYSNASAFILSVIFQETTGQSIYSYAKEFIFDPLLIKNHSWKYYGKYCAGCTGLSLSNNDLHKIGQLLLFDNEIYHEIIPKQFITDMLTPQISVGKPYCFNPLHPKSYGYFVWICDNSIYYISGSRGQYIIVSPSNSIIVTMQANISDTYPVIKQLIPIILSND